MKNKFFRNFFVVSLALAFFLNFGGYSAVAAPVGGSSQFVNVLVGFTSTPGASEHALVRSHGGSVSRSFTLVPAVAATLPQSAVSALLSNPRVTVVELDGEVWAIDFESELNNTWGVKRIGAGEVHEFNRGTGVKVAIIDSGIDYNHPDLFANYAGGYDFVNNDNDPMDDNGHGTHVAGTVAAVRDGAGVVGASPEARLYALKVLNSSGGGSWSNIIAALEWAVENGIQVTNNSYGAGTNPGSTVQAAFDNSYALGVLHVAAAGNSGNCGGRGNNVGYPARFESVIAVAATNQNDTRPCFSSTGPDVELSAPGVSINSTIPGGGYAEWNGTSMASPHVAGVAALVIAEGVASNNNVRQILRDTADDLGDPNHYGYGLVNAFSAVAAATPPVTGTISGTVVNSNTLEAIVGAKVTDGTRSATTDEAGSYVISDVPEGTYTVTASANGYESASQEAAVTGDTVTIVDFSLQPSPETDNSMAVDSITYSTNGGKNNDRHLTTTVSVVDSNGNAVSGASVSITLTNDSGGSWSSTATTGEAGTVSFSLNNAPSGCYTTIVDNVTKDGLEWDGATPLENGFCK